MSNDAFDRDAYAIELLELLAEGGRFDGDQMGPDHTLDQISVAAELIEMGYMMGHPFPDSRHPENIGGPGITAKGRRYLTKRLKSSQAKKAGQVSNSATESAPVPAPLSLHGQTAESLRYRLSELSKRLGVDLGTDRLNEHLERIAAIKQNLDQLDVYDFASVPERAISNIAGNIDGLLELFDQSLIPAGNLEKRHESEFNRPGPLVLNSHNLSNWQEKIATIQMNVFAATAPVLLHQTRRRLERTAGQHVDLNVAGADLPDDSVVWKYFPMRNFLRSALCSGIWMSSMEKLKQWSEKQRGIVDVNEGAVPPVLQKFAAEFYDALIGGEDKAMESVKEKYPFVVQSVAKVSDILDTMEQTSRILVSSWALKKSESTGMWMHYADNARGLAIRTTIGKLKKAYWRTPFHLSATNGSDITFYGLLMRKVSYFTFTGEDRLACLEDCYVPFLKREEFEDERELRVIGFSTSPLAQHGLVLHCDLSELIDEIVAGPKADENGIKQLIADKLPLLQRIPIRRSTCAPRNNEGR